MIRWLFASYAFWKRYKNVVTLIHKVFKTFHNLRPKYCHCDTFKRSLLPFSRIFLLIYYLQWRIQGGAWGPVSPFLDIFFTKANLLAKMSIKRVRNLSQKAENGHFSDSNFQKFLRGMPSDPPIENSRLRRSLVPPFQNPGSTPDLFACNKTTYNRSLSVDRTPEKKGQGRSCRNFVNRIL